MECIHNCERCFYLTNGNLDEGGWGDWGGLGGIGVGGDYVLGGGPLIPPLNIDEYILLYKLNMAVEDILWDK